MPGKRSATSGYARIAQAEEDEEEEEEEEWRASSDEADPFRDPLLPLSTTPVQYASTQPRARESMSLPPSGPPPRRGRPRRANSGVDIKAINARLERWADEIKVRFTRRRIKGKSSVKEQLEIHHSVFQAPDWIRPATKEMLESRYDNDAERISKLEFDDMVQSVRTAIEIGVHPKLISQGSSGSYFARDSSGKVLGVFKPKDEEPYASKNPKWTKWIHRNLFPFAFGRAMLIPNLSYVSEAAAYVLDCQLRTNLVPYTDVVGLSSKSFYYDWMDRRAYYRKGKPFPEKLGSFQVFLQGYKGATEFLREHPWPDQASGYSGAAAPTKRRKRWNETCRPRRLAGADESYDSDEEDEDVNTASQDGSDHAYWTEELQQSFREELEKLVILDYIMRNTDRGSDNWMIRIDREKKTASIVKEAPKGYHRRNESMSATPAINGKETDGTAIPRIGAIDNSLSWPWKHPDAWRSYPFGWLFLPLSLIGRPFSDKSRKHFLPLLTSKSWWSQTQVKLRECFEIDVDFQDRMFARQMAVMKGQAWNVVETLKTADHGPLELTRRNRVHVWDDLVDIPVAVSLPRASEEMRRRARAMNAEERAKRTAAAVTTPPSGYPPEERRDDEYGAEEMDISSARPPSSSSPGRDLLSLSLPGTSLPETALSNRFSLSREHSADGLYRPPKQDAGPQQPLLQRQPLSPARNSRQLDHSPAPVRTTTSFSLPIRGDRDGERMSPHGSHPDPSGPARNPTGHGRYRGSGRAERFAPHLPRSATEDDGDLGFSAAADHEHCMRKVIVERLEMVKSKAPVFTWC